MADDTRFAFVVEWYEELASRTRIFQFLYFSRSKSIEMFDIKTRKMFLKTNLSACQIELQDLYIGASINVLGRQLKIVDYADEFTKKKLMTKLERTLAFIKPDAVGKLGDILGLIADQGLIVAKLRFCKVSQTEAHQFYQDMSDVSDINVAINSMSSGSIIAIEIVGENAIQRWLEMAGPTDPAKARSEAATSVRARFGTDIARNAVHASKDQASAARELEYFFPSNKKQTLPNCVLGSGSTLCLIKPHALKSGDAGKIINFIQDNGFTINTVQLFTLEKANVEEFYEVYKGVVHEYPGMVNELGSGPFLAMEILGKDSETVPLSFRELCGPMDPEIARQLRPQSIRAKFGLNKIQNAVHCTDLPEDAALEVEYFFKVLDR